MPDFQFLRDSLSHLWVIMAPRRQTRPNIAHATESAVCPFCVGQEGQEEELFRISNIKYPISNEQSNDVSSIVNSQSDWAVRVLANKYPFAPHHEVIIHSPDHHKNIDELPVENVQLLLQAYKARFIVHQKKGKVYIFHNHGIDGGESLPHPHSQLVVIPKEVEAHIPLLPTIPENHYKTDHVTIFCPDVLQWPDEVWIAPRDQGRTFVQLQDAEIADLALVLQRVIQLMDMRHGHEFPFNFYISPDANWYIRLIPRIKRLGGFEVGTGIFVNTQDPKETIEFIKEHFENPDVEKIQREQKAAYATEV